jgi:hypothetical protein
MERSKDLEHIQEKPIDAAWIIPHQPISTDHSAFCFGAFRSALSAHRAIHEAALASALAHFRANLTAIPTRSLGADFLIALAEARGRYRAGNEEVLTAFRETSAAFREFRDDRPCHFCGLGSGTLSKTDISERRNRRNELTAIESEASGFNSISSRREW